MKIVLSPQTELELIHRLAEAAENREAAERIARSEYKAAVEECQAKRKQSRKLVEEKFGVELKETEQAYEQELTAIADRFAQRHEQTQFEYVLAVERLESSYRDETASASKRREKQRQQAQAQHAKEIAKADDQLAKARKARNATVEKVEELREDARTWLTECRLGSVADEVSTETSPPSSPDAKTLRETTAQVSDELVALAALRLPAAFRGNRFWGSVFAVWASGVVPAVLALIVMGMQTVPAAIAGSLGLAALCGAVAFPLHRSMYAKAKRQATQAWLRFDGMLRRLETAAEQFLADRVDRDKHRRKIAEKSLAERTEQIAFDYSQSKTKADEELLRRRCSVNDAYPRLQATLCHERDIAVRRVILDYRPRFRQLREEIDRQSSGAQVGFSEKMDDLKRELEAELRRLSDEWRQTSMEIRRQLERLTQECDEWFPSWEAAAWETWPGKESTPPSVRVGQFQLELAPLLHGYAPPALDGESPDRLQLPALLPFPETGSLLVKAGGEAKGRSNQLLAAVMLRYLTAFPPGTVRFTILDPVGLGKDFASFMHLADYNEQLVASRIWTEPQQISQRLSDLTEHMENVLQKYLRSEFASIDEYNASAGEVAEAYRILVVANFPAGFNESTAERLTSVISSGPRCGVYTLMSLDQDRLNPQGFSLADLKPHCQIVEWDGKRFRLDGPFERCELELDTPPSTNVMGRIVHRIGQMAKDVAKVEVPFARVAPAPVERWTAVSDEGIDVPVGPAGARKLLSLRLGKGTSQHVLMAGKTGSGKSTLLHVLITNLALRYSPDEVELYLIDFKKGVEFKRYATHRLPHARVVGIESDREFGLSVMQRLDEVMQRRGERFRELGVGDLKGYRRRRPDEPLPRILFLVDEFQELFIDEDKVAQEAAMLLDRLVRQGRAFGIHVLLGSQTLAGEYSIPRSTVGQMAVRIALQCSDADAHLILSDDNMAARLLSRPGEAIYNDANGLVEGNAPFQVAWLTDDESESLLDDVRQLALERGADIRPQIVFEGARPADHSANPKLDALIAAADWPQAQRAFTVYLGEPVAITDPCSVLFRREGGKNLLMIGQNPEAGLALLGTSVVCLALQHPPQHLRNGAAGATFYLFDGSPSDDPAHGYFEKLADGLPHPCVVGGFREAAGELQKLATELDRRIEQADLAAPAIYLVLHDLQRFRDIRKSEDEFGFSSYDEEPKADPSKQLATLLRDGPAYGVHTLVWCDGWNNLNRTFDRGSIGEFEMRVLFQMSANDSSLLIDSPAASRLGPYRAFSHNQAMDTLEKFRPYRLPPDDWLSSIREAMQRRSP